MTRVEMLKAVNQRAHEIQKDAHKMITEAVESMTKEQKETMEYQDLFNSFLFTKIANLEIQMEFMIKEIEKKQNF